MASQYSLLFALVFLFSIYLPSSLHVVVVAQNCGCSLDLCCSQHGYCGSTDEYCGRGCREGPCSSGQSTGGPSSASVESIVTPEFFNGIQSQAGGGCEGSGFYTRDAFLAAAQLHPDFGTTGSVEKSKLEIAAFFAHVTHETGHLCHIRETNRGTYCDENKPGNPCVEGQSYYGRGPLQLTWNYNYGPAGSAIGFDGLNNPDKVAEDVVISFRAALWFWMTNVHSGIVSGSGFGPSIRAINGIECDGKRRDLVDARVRYFQDYCGQLNVSPGDNLYC